MEIGMYSCLLFGGWETLNWHQQQKNTSSFHDMKIHSLFVSTGVSEN